jgi:hypothetical protein
MRALGLHFIQFLDDLPFAAPSALLATAHGRLMLETLRSFGWIVHIEKCIGIDHPIQCFDALGSTVDLLHGLYRTPASRMERSLALAAELLTITHPLVRLVAQVKGLFGSMWLGVGEHTRIRTRSLDKVIDSRLQPGDDPAARCTWRRRVALTADAKAELSWWIKHLARIDGRPIRPQWLAGHFDGTIATDASDTGFGGWVSLESLGPAVSGSSLVRNILRQAGQQFSTSSAVDAARRGLEVWGPLPPTMQGSQVSSTLREMYGASQLLWSLRSILAGGRFRLHLDNMCCVMGLGGKVPATATGGKEPKSVLGGSKVAEIQAYIIKIMDLACDYDIQLVAIWVPRAQNERSDLLSRRSAFAKAEYHLSDTSFAELDRMWGHHTLDVFSLPTNVRVISRRFMSKFYHPGSIWVDSLSVRWPTDDVIWAHPPPRLVGAAIQQFQSSQARGTLIVPLWRAAAWWPLIYPRGRRWGPASFITDVRRLGYARDVMSGLNLRSSSNFGSSVILALQIDCRPSAEQIGGQPSGAAGGGQPAERAAPSPASR